MNPQPKHRAIRLKGLDYKKLQVAVLKRDNYTCQECGYGTQAPAHHIKFRSQGGSDIMENLTTLCVVCHHKKHN